MQQQLRDKLGFWTMLPHSLISIAAPFFGLGSVEQARERARTCVAEFDEAVDQGRCGKLHRVARKFLENGSIFRVQIFAFSQGAMGLQECTQLLYELVGYALVPVVSRRTEAVHSSILTSKRKATCQKIPWLAARIRRPDVSRALSGGDFMDFLQGNWNKRDILRRTLSYLLTSAKLSRMSKPN